jgi:uncharacterized phage-like protein YoqJ
MGSLVSFADPAWTLFIFNKKTQRMVVTKKKILRNIIIILNKTVVSLSSIIQLALILKYKTAY